MWCGSPTLVSSIIKKTLQMRFSFCVFISLAVLMCVYVYVTGLFAYSSGCLVVVEDLSNSNQTHLTGESRHFVCLSSSLSFCHPQVTVRRSPLWLPWEMGRLSPALATPMTPPPARSGSGNCQPTNAQKYHITAHEFTLCSILIFLQVMKFHRHAVTSMAFSRDDRFLLSLGT